MPRILSFLVALVLTTNVVFAQPATAPAPTERVKIILDTDLGNDVDDAGTLAVLHALADRGEIEILCVGVVNGHPNAVPLADAINTYFGRPDLPLGAINKKDAPIRDDTFFMGKIAEAYPHDLTQENAPDVIDLYRKTLAAQPDRSVTLVVVGQATNIMNLLKSQPDKHSPLNGVELVRQKIKFYSSGGNGRAKLPKGQAGWNYTNDKNAAAYELEHFPREVPFVEAGGSGLTIKVGSCFKDAPEDNIIRKSYENYFKGVAKDKSTWDQMRLLYGVRQSFRDLFELSPPGSITMDKETGHITWSAEPNRNQAYAYVKPENKKAVAAALQELMMHQPKKP